MKEGEEFPSTEVLAHPWAETAGGLVRSHEAPQLGPGPQWCQELQHQLEGGAPTPPVGAVGSPSPMWDLGAAPTMQGRAGVGGNGLVTHQSMAPGSWAARWEHFAFCIKSALLA